MKIKLMNAMAAAACLLTVMPVVSARAAVEAEDRLEEVVVTQAP
jgi:hypothetical protein